MKDQIGIMEQIIVNQIGNKPVYIERNEGNVYIGDTYVEDPASAFNSASFELLDYTPTIEPAIIREEVVSIQEWIDMKASADKTARLALLYGKAGIGKSIVMHELLERLRLKENYIVLGLKSDQIEFVDTDHLRSKMHLARPIEVVIKEMSLKYRRVVLLIDQIDALSLSLSSNRTPLRSLLKMITQVKDVPNVRIVISCRPYDLEYDPLLDNLKIKNKWELKELSKDQVLQTLKENDCNDRLSDNLMLFLGNPLHLYLFLKVRPYEQLTDPLSTDVLYHQIWKKYINDESIRNVDKDKLLSLLDSLVGKMYQRQELSVHVRELETKYDAELKYLFTNGILIITKNGQVQFFHQTLFDYVYARRFMENGGDLLESLKAQHQGLFSRSSVKSILMFLREQNVSSYVYVLEQLLYAKDSDAKDVYRFHLKSLALSTLAYFESPLQEELNFIFRRVYDDRVYMDVIFESIYTTNWFNAIWSIIDRKGGWERQLKETKDKIVSMCQRVLWHNAEVVLEKLDSVIDYEDERECRYLENILRNYNLNCDSSRLIIIYRKLVSTKNPQEYTYLLRNILKENPGFVCEELVENIKQKLSDKEPYVHRIGVSHDVALLYEDILKDHHDLAIDLFIDILNMVYESSKYEIAGHEIYHSTEFFIFQRVNGAHTFSHLAEDIVNILIDDFLENVELEKTRLYVTEFSKSIHEGFVFIALYVYASCPKLFLDEIVDILTNRHILCNAPSWVEYQAVEALRVSFPLMTDVQKKRIVDRILSIHDDSEYSFYQKDNLIRLEYGHPILDVDIHKGKALDVIDLAELKKLSWSAYQERQRIDRKFRLERLENTKPSSMSMHTGWTSLKAEQGLKMSCEMWHKSMLTYVTNPMDWDKPSLTGQCHLFRDVVSQDPEKYIGLIDQIICDDRILISYPKAGMQGLLDAGRVEDALHVLEGILKVVDNDVNSNKRGFDILSLLFAIDDITKQEEVPEIIIQLLCNTLTNAKEPEVDNSQQTNDIYNVGLNQPRGNAGHLLVKCASEIKYSEDIFRAIESVAEKSSIYTRAAILVNMAILNRFDKDRNVHLYKRLLHDFDPRLMALPVHNYNPLVYFVNYALEDMMDLFNHAINYPECYPQQVIILWLAWSHNDRERRVQALLDKMCDTSQGARLSLLRFFGTFDENTSDDVVTYVLYLMEPRFDSPEMGEGFDNLFHRLKKWPEGIQYTITESYVNSPLCKHRIIALVEYLGGYAIKDPIQTLKWLETLLSAGVPDDYYVWNHIVEVVIQSYNGIKSFNDNYYQNALEHAMDLIDLIMQNQNNKYLISNFINKLDNE